MAVSSVEKASQHEVCNSEYRPEGGRGKGKRNARGLRQQQGKEPERVYLKQTGKSKIWNAH